MRKLLILRGAPGSGKSTWIKENRLENYVINPDSIRLMYASPYIGINGKIGINQAVNNVVWHTAFEILEYRMNHGEFTVVDATHCKARDMNKYKYLAEKYRYSVYCVDFSDISLAELLCRNEKRESLRQVPEYAIKNLYNDLMASSVPEWITTIKPNEIGKVWEEKFIIPEKYSNVQIIGDIHGCFDTLMKTIDGQINPDCFYIFTGDLLDRGPDNEKVLRFALELVDKENVVFVTGNHEKHIWNYANNFEVKSEEFIKNTAPQIKDIPPRDMKKFCKLLKDCFWFEFKRKDYFVSHGGMANLVVADNFSLEKNISLISTTDYIHGSGRYPDSAEAAASFGLTQSSLVQFHGHRNIGCKDFGKNPVLEGENTYNLEAGVERGGEMRSVILTSDSIITKEIKNEKN